MLFGVLFKYFNPFSADCSLDHDVNFLLMLGLLNLLIYLLVVLAHNQIQLLFSFLLFQSLALKMFFEVALRLLPVVITPLFHKLLLLLLFFKCFLVLEKDLCPPIEFLFL